MESGGRESFAFESTECPDGRAASPLRAPVLQASFCEAGTGWRAVPDWVRFLIRFGFEWPSSPSGPRRIALVSLPCDSAAAGLITLGSVIRDLCNPEAQDAGSHYESLLRFARQYLECCRSCTLRCEPDIRGCGFLAQSGGQLRHLDGARYEIAALSDRAEWGDAIRCSRVSRNRREDRWMLRNYCADWHIEGEAPLRATPDAAPSDLQAYRSLVPDARFVSQNAGRSFSGLCLAARAGGESATRDMCATISFRSSDAERSLPELLTIHHWGAAGSASRVSLFNPRTGRFDRFRTAPSLVIADGDASFLAVLRQKELQRSDVIGVIHRALERERLEAIGDRLTGLRQWYAEDAAMAAGHTGLPRGISAMVLRRGRAA